MDQVKKPVCSPLITEVAQDTEFHIEKINDELFEMESWLDSSILQSNNTLDSNQVFFLLYVNNDSINFPEDNQNELITYIKKKAKNNVLFHKGIDLHAHEKTRMLVMKMYKSDSELILTKFNTGELEKYSVFKLSVTDFFNMNVDKYMLLLNLLDILDANRSLVGLLAIQNMIDSNSKIYLDIKSCVMKMKNIDECFQMKKNMYRYRDCLTERKGVIEEAERILKNKKAELKRDSDPNRCK